MKHTAIFLLSLPLFLASCGGEGGKSSSTSPDSGDTGESASSGQVSSSKENVTPDLPDLPVMDDSKEHVDNGVTVEKVRALLEETIKAKKTLKESSYSKTVYLRSSGDNPNVESETRKYRFFSDDDRGEIMTGRVAYRRGNGAFEPVIDENSGYDYDIQSYAEAGYLHYIEKVEEGVTSRVSYDNISKNNRYNNLYSIYAANPDTVMMESVLDAIDGYHGGAKETARYIDQIGDELILKIATTEYSSYTSYNYDDFFYVHMDLDGTKINRVDTGFLVYDLGADKTDESYYQAIRKESCYGFSYGKRDSFGGILLNEKDVDKTYGVTPQHLVDLSAMPDGVLSAENASEILSNLQTFAEGTTSTETSFSYDSFVDRQASADVETGEYKVLGEANGTATTRLYEGDFVESLATLTLENSSAGTKEIAVVSQAEADDVGMRIVTDADSTLKSHKHVYEASEIDDPLPFVGVHPIYRTEIFEPFRIAGALGVNCSSDSPLDDDNNFYTSAGAVSKNGNRVSGRLTKVFHKNVWTPYWTYGASFEIVDGFLEEVSMSVQTYIESDTQQITFYATLSFQCKKGEVVAPFTGEKLDPSLYEEGDVLAKNEWLYM